MGFFRGSLSRAFICSAARPLLPPISDPGLLLSICSVGAWLTDKSLGRFSFSGQQEATWSESGIGATALLSGALEILSEYRWGRVVDSGWTAWDLRVYYDPLVYLQVRTTEENHGGNKRLIRVHQSIRPRDLTLLVLAAATTGLVAFVAACFGRSWGVSYLQSPD